MGLNFQPPILYLEPAPPPLEQTRALDFAAPQAALGYQLKLVFHQSGGYDGSGKVVKLAAIIFCLF